LEINEIPKDRLVRPNLTRAPHDVHLLLSAVASELGRGLQLQHVAAQIVAAYVEIESKV